jgi:hypothetical protein
MEAKYLNFFFLENPKHNFFFLLFFRIPTNELLDDDHPLILLIVYQTLKGNISVFC